MLYTRSGAEWTGEVLGGNKPYAIAISPCLRCGGAGGWKGWPDFTCYRCGGVHSMTHEHTKYVLYTAEKLAKLNAAAAKREQAKSDKHLAIVAEAFSALSADGQSAYVWAGFETCDEPVARDIRARFERIGGMSPAQEELIIKLWKLSIQRATDKASALDCPVGKVTITGTIVSTKSVESDYGSTLKMLVLSDDGWKVFGTVPDSIFDGASIKGRVVTFTATVEASRDDSKFGFFKRPTKATIEPVKEEEYA